MPIILNRRCGRVLAGLALAALAAGCSSNPYKWDKKTADKLESTLEQASKENNTRIPADVNAALLPPLQMRIPEGGGAPLEGRFDLSLNNAPARSVFMGLVEGTPYSIVVAPDINGSMSLHLKNTTVPEAMEAIRRGYRNGSV